MATQKISLAKMGVDNNRIYTQTEEEKERAAQRKKDLERWRGFQKGCPQHIWVTANPLLYK